MHSTYLPQGITAIHNGDFSGDVTFSIGPDVWNASNNVPKATMGEGVEVKIPFEAIRALYLSYMRGKLISELEQMNDNELELRLGGL